MIIENRENQENCSKEIEKIRKVHAERKFGNKSSLKVRILLSMKEV